MGPTGEQRPALSLLLSQNLTRFKGPWAVCLDQMLSMTMAFFKGPSTFYPGLTQYDSIWTSLRQETLNVLKS